MTPCADDELRNLRRSIASTEFVTVRFKATTELIDQLVEIALTRGHTDPTNADWQTADWTGDPGLIREAQLLVPAGSLALGTWSVWGRVTDNPEVPVLAAGTLTIF